MVEDGETASDSDGENGTEQLVAEQLVSITWLTLVFNPRLSGRMLLWICWTVGYCWIGRTSQGFVAVHHSRQSHAAAPPMNHNGKNPISGNAVCVQVFVIIY